MAKTATETKTRAATRGANTKTKKDVEEKPKREPTAYQVFCKKHMKKWNEENPGRAKEAMAQMAAMWKDAPENVNRGKDPKARKPKAPKEPKAKAPAKATTSKPRAKKTKEVVVEEEEDEGDEEEASEAAEESD